ncbi:3-demethylubiquinone-9 3-methyltransferase [Nitrincola nitratireducens]|uniref:3-demethylubiquinone-9 3-methyltransferase n=1 Tax=Nitrincola nitratireducens TaxID=1229521 RepID=W9V3Y5_9GAMM|nr:3-demethylubiquinone-9 3-methyltransferase [Nitrincola nitratireducens]
MSNTRSLNIDPAEIAKFEELASRWWDTNSEFKPYTTSIRCGWALLIA